MEGPYFKPNSPLRSSLVTASTPTGAAVFVVEADADPDAAVLRRDPGHPHEHPARSQPLDDPAGEWTVKLCDAVSGVIGEGRLRVQ